VFEIGWVQFLEVIIFSVPYSNCINQSLWSYRIQYRVNYYANYIGVSQVSESLEKINEPTLSLDLRDGLSTATNRGITDVLSGREELHGSL